MAIDVAEFLDKNCGLVKGVANKYYFETSKFSYEDLIAVGNQAVIKALDRFDESLGYRPTTYICWAIDRDIREFVRRNKHDLFVSTYAQRKHYKENKTETEQMGPASPVAVRLDWNWDIEVPESDDTGTLAEVIPSGEAPPEQKLMVDEQKDILLEEIARLPEREQQVVMGRYFEGASFVDLGAELGVTKQRAKQIEQKAFKTLRTRLNSRLGGFIARPDGLARRAK